MFQANSLKNRIVVLPVSQLHHAANTHAIMQDVMELFDQGRYWIVLDLSDTGHLHSALIGAILTLSQYLGRKGGALALVNPFPQYDELLTLTRVHEFTPVRRSVEEAVKALANQTANQPQFALAS